VNSKAKSLTTEYLHKAAAIADTFRPYGIKVYLSARFNAPMELGGLDTADPMDPEVRAWWVKKADEIYSIIPDFGGFLVKANSEGQPGPITYGRTHADGANMLAKALEPHGGIVMWRAFVYDPDDTDRIGQAYTAMKPDDGRFADNVLLQVKNGPLDFQPREPFSPLFGTMPKTQLMPELQVTQEYLGQSRQLAFLAPMWREFLDSDTYAKGEGSTVSKVMDGSLFGGKLTGVAGVANTGSDRNWTGHDLAQANWYAFGRLAWAPELSSEQIVDEWIRMSLTQTPSVIQTISKIMLESREAVVDYMTPLGLAHIMWQGHHYGPEPWCDTLSRPDWNPVYYHQADSEGIGFDRTKTGSAAAEQYMGKTHDDYVSLEKCPENLLLWFHHVSWDYKMNSGKTLWNELCLHYQRGVDWVEQARKQWTALEGSIDSDVYSRVSDKLAVQEKDAGRWRDACILYFQTFSKREIPDGVDKPTLTLEQIKKDPPLEYP
jgi:alpha-glucuronidase